MNFIYFFSFNFYRYSRFSYINKISTATLNLNLVDHNFIHHKLILDSHSIQIWALAQYLHYASFPVLY